MIKKAYEIKGSSKIWKAIANQMPKNGAFAARYGVRAIVVLTVEAEKVLMNLCDANSVKAKLIQEVI